MENVYRNLLIIMTLIIQFQFLLTYPSPKLDPQRSFLRCQFSAVACKRNLLDSNENDKFVARINGNNLRKCIEEKKSIWFCLIQSQSAEN